ncbi:MAG TPA: hypothetical protein VEL29_05610, partial [Gemmatimonadales bacterium]|nr:hypothetical protein [Gemmatimonadales bacterium]
WRTPGKGPQQEESAHACERALFGDGERHGPENRVGGSRTRALVFNNLCVSDRPPPLRVTPQIEDRLHAFYLVLDHGLRAGPVNLEAQDPQVRLCTHVAVVNDS